MLSYFETCSHSLTHPPTHTYTHTLTHTHTHTHTHLHTHTHAHTYTPTHPPAITTTQLISHIQMLCKLFTWKMYNCFAILWSLIIWWYNACHLAKRFILDIQSYIILVSLSWVSMTYSTLPYYSWFYLKFLTRQINERFIPVYLLFSFTFNHTSCTILRWLC